MIESSCPVRKRPQENRPAAAEPVHYRRRLGGPREPSMPTLPLKLNGPAYRLFCWTRIPEGRSHRQAENSLPVVEVCRKMGIAEQTFYRWKKRYVGMGVAEVRRLKVLEEENRKLRQLVADLSLDKHMLQDVLRKKP